MISRRVFLLAHWIVRRPRTPILVACIAFSAHELAQVPGPAANGTLPAVAPDGRLIAFVSTRDGARALYVMNADGSGVRRISSDQTLSGRPFWLRDARSVLATSRRGDTTLVLSFPLAGGAPEVMTRIASVPGGFAPFPDGKRYVFGVGGWREMQLESARSDGSDRRRLTDGRAAHWCPQVSRDGKMIAVGRRDSVSWQIWVMNSDGSGGRTLLSFAKAEGSTECPQWSPDGRRITFQSGMRVPTDTTKTTAHIWVVDLAGGAPVQLAPHASPWLDETPTWFPDGKRIAFQSDRTGAWEIWVMNADGTDQRQLTRGIS